MKTLIFLICSSAFEVVVGRLSANSNDDGSIEKLLANLETAYKRKEEEADDTFEEVIERCLHRFVDHRCVDNCIAAYGRRNTGFNADTYECSRLRTASDKKAKRLWYGRWWIGSSTHGIINSPPHQKAPKPGVYNWG